MLSQNAVSCCPLHLSAGTGPGVHIKRLTVRRLRDQGSLIHEERTVDLSGSASILPQYADRPTDLPPPARGFSAMIRQKILLVHSQILTTANDSRSHSIQSLQDALAARQVLGAIDVALVVQSREIRNTAGGSSERFHSNAFCLSTLLPLVEQSKYMESMRFCQSRSPNQFGTNYEQIRRTLRVAKS